MVAERIYIRESYESKLSKIKPKYKSAEDYYNNVEISKVHGGKKVCDTLASISKLVIRVITRKNIAEGDIDVQLLEYGQDQDQEIVRECIYLFHDEETQQYAFLSCTDETSKQTLTRFPRTNQVMSKMFLELIQNEINGKKSDMKSTIDWNFSLLLESVSMEKPNEDVFEPSTEHNGREWIVFFSILPLFLDPDPTEHIGQLTAMQEPANNPTPSYSEAVAIHPSIANQPSLYSLSIILSI